MLCNKTYVYKYNVINNHWCEVDVKDLKDLSDYSCVKYSTC